MNELKGDPDVKPRVLVVDDAIFMRKMITDILENNGFEVVGEADTGSGAFESYKQRCCI